MRNIVENITEEELMEMVLLEGDTKELYGNTEIKEEETIKDTTQMNKDIKEETIKDRIEKAIKNTKQIVEAVKEIRQVKERIIKDKEKNIFDKVNKEDTNNKKDNVIHLDKNIPINERVTEEIYHNAVMEDIAITGQRYKANSKKIEEIYKVLEKYDYLDTIKTKNEFINAAKFNVMLIHNILDIKDREIAKFKDEDLQVVNKIIEITDNHIQDANLTKEELSVPNKYNIMINQGTDATDGFNDYVDNIRTELGIEKEKKDIKELTNIFRNRIKENLGKKEITEDEILGELKDDKLYDAEIDIKLNELSKLQSKVLNTQLITLDNGKEVFREATINTGNNTIIANTETIYDDLNRVIETRTNNGMEDIIINKYEYLNDTGTLVKYTTDGIEQKLVYNEDYTEIYNLNKDGTKTLIQEVEYNEKGLLIKSVLVEINKVTRFIYDDNDLLVKEIGENYVRELFYNKDKTLRLIIQDNNISKYEYTDNTIKITTIQFIDNGIYDNIHGVLDLNKIVHQDIINDLTETDDKVRIDVKNNITTRYRHNEKDIDINVLENKVINAHDYYITKNYNDANIRVYRKINNKDIMILQMNENNNPIYELYIEEQLAVYREYDKFNRIIKEFNNRGVERIYDYETDAINVKDNTGSNVNKLLVELEEYL